MLESNPINEILPVKYNRQAGPDTWLMGFSSASIASGARPGQFLMVQPGKTKDPLLGRPFSIHGIRNKEEVMILYKIAGKGTSLMSAMKEDDNISVTGPLGKSFPYPGQKGPIILVAGGIGVAPLFFLAKTLNKTEKERVRIFLGFPTSQEAILVDQLVVSGFNLTLATDDGSLGEKGFITDLLEQYLDNNVSCKSTIYACGPTAMLKKVAQKALNLNLKCYVTLEGHMACGLGICQGCAVKSAGNKSDAYYHVCKDGPVFAANLIDWGKI